jgi:hypothetical protein
MKQRIRGDLDELGRYKDINEDMIHQASMHIEGSVENKQCILVNILVSSKKLRKLHEASRYLEHHIIHEKCIFNMQVLEAP